MIEDIKIKVEIVRDAMQAYCRGVTIFENAAAIPIKEVDAMLRVYCSYLNDIMELIDEEMKGGI